MGFQADWEGVGGITDGMTYEFEEGIIFKSLTANTTPLTFRGASGQSADFIQFQNVNSVTAMGLHLNGFWYGNSALKSYAPLVIQAASGARILMIGTIQAYLEAYASASDFTLQSYSANRSLILKGYPPDAGIGIILDTRGTLTNGKLTSIRNAGSEKAYFEFDGSLWLGNAKYKGKTSSTGAPTTTEYPNDGDWGFHKDTNTGTLYLAFNDGGTIKTITLS